MTLRALDLFCGAGGASMGLHHAGFEVVGVDIAPQPHYPFEFHQADALTFPLEGYDLIWASPVCKGFSPVTRLAGTQHLWPDQITPIRERLVAWGGPYIIENVPSAPLRNALMLCGTMFGLRVYRHRKFESSLFLFAPQHIRHEQAERPQVGRPINGPIANGYITVAGHFSGVAQGREAMGISWMGQSGLAQAVPPSYAEFLGKQVVEQLSRGPSVI